MKGIFAVLLGGSLLILGCSEGFEGPEPQAPSIGQSYRSLAIHYNARSVGGILAFYSPAYLHDGVVFADLDSIWTERIGDGSTQVIALSVATAGGDSITQASIDIIYSSGGENDTIHIEPGTDYDDICFWTWDGELWKLIGNQRSGAARIAGSSGHDRR